MHQPNNTSDEVDGLVEHVIHTPASSGGSETQPASAASPMSNGSEPPSATSSIDSPTIGGRSSNAIATLNTSTITHIHMNRSTASHMAATSAALEHHERYHMEEEESLHLDDTDLDVEEHMLENGEARTRGIRGAIASNASPESSIEGSTPSRFLMVCSWLALLGSVLSMSATGPMFLFLQRLGISPILACVWRNQCTCLFLLIPAWIEWRRIPAKDKAWDKWRVKGTGLGRRRVSRVVVVQPASSSSNTTGTTDVQFTREHYYIQSKDWHVLWYMFGVSVVWSCSLVLWVSSLPFTTTARASLLTSIYPLLLCLYLKFGPAKVALSLGEITGVVVSFLGIATCEVASMNEQPSQEHEGLDSGMLLAGDGLCLASAFFIAADIVISKKARQVVPLFVYTLSTCFLTLILLTFLSLTLEETSLFSMHPTSGVFGWMTSEKDMWLMNIAFGVLEGAIGLLGFNFAIKYVPHLIFSSVQLLDPGVTGIMSWFAGLEQFPTHATFLGIGIVTTGIAIVFVQQQKREEREKLALAGMGPNSVEMTNSRAHASATGSASTNKSVNSVSSNRTLYAPVGGSDKQSES